MLTKVQYSPDVPCLSTTSSYPFFHPAWHVTTCLGVITHLCQYTGNFYLLMVHLPRTFKRFLPLIHFTKFSLFLLLNSEGAVFLQWRFNLLLPAANYSTCLAFFLYGETRSFFLFPSSFVSDWFMGATISHSLGSPETQCVAKDNVVPDLPVPTSPVLGFQA